MRPPSTGKTVEEVVGPSRTPVPTQPFPTDMEPWDCPVPSLRFRSRSNTTDFLLVTSLFIYEALLHSPPCPLRGYVPDPYSQQKVFHRKRDRESLGVTVSTRTSTPRVGSESRAGDKRRTRDPRRDTVESRPLREPRPVTRESSQSLVLASESTPGVSSSRPVLRDSLPSPVVGVPLL